MKLSTEKTALLRHFRKDPVLFAYHIGDLDDFFFPRCQWIVDEEDSGEINEAILYYNNPPFQTVLAFGVTDRFELLLEQALGHFPERFFCHYNAGYERIFESKYALKRLGTHHKMKLRALNILFDSSDYENVVRLNASHKDGLLALYDRAYPESYFDERMLRTGRYFGCLDGEKIVAVAGIHVYSKKYNIATLGNIVTDTDHRGKGLATLVTSRLVEELAAEGNLISLNVRADNKPAIACYRRIGFETACEYEEAIFECKR